MTTNKTRFIRSLPGASTLLLLSAPALSAATNLITNGDFSLKNANSTATGWTLAAKNQVDPTISFNTTLNSDALNLRRAIDVGYEYQANPPGVGQTFTVDSSVDSITISFDYVNTDGSVLIFRILDGNYYGNLSGENYNYYNPASSSWETVRLWDRNNLNKYNWGLDASDSSQSSTSTSLANNTARLDADGLNHYSITLPLIEGKSTYTIEFYNAYAGTTVAIDNIVVAVAAVPEPAMVSLMAGLLIVPLAGWITIRRRKPCV
jgi:hypothetical protein